jgi:hypothetical protein
VYAIYQSGAAIYGVGATPEAAWQAAREWLDPDTTLEDIHPAVQRGEVPGALYLRPCSEALAEAVRAEGGAQSYTIDEAGLLRLTRELAEDA